MNRLKIAIIGIFFFWVQSLLIPIEMKPLRQITLSEDDGIIERGHSFIITDDNRILIIDSKASNLKFFDITGKRLNTLGRKGVGPDEFILPLYSTYRKPLIAFMDIGRNFIFIYKLVDGGNPEFVRKFFSQYMGYSLRFVNEESLLIAGEKSDKKNRWYSLYEYNFIKNRYDYILPSHVAYGCSSPEEYEKDNEERLSYIGSTLFLDVFKERIYLAWKGSNEVLKINRKTKEIKRFVKKSKNYVKPYYNAEIVRAFNQKSHREIYKHIRKMSMGRDIFVTKSENVGVVYAGPYKEDNTLPIMLQLYTANGKFLKEVELLKAKSSHHYEVYFYFKKSNNRFYIMDTETSEEFDQLYKIHEFQVIE